VVATKTEPENVRESVVLVATRLFAASGFDGTSLQDIADGVGVTKPAVLHYFPSKEHVRAAVLDGIVAHWNDTLPKLLLAATRSSGRFDAVLGEVYRFFADEPDRARVVLREALDRPNDLKKVIRGPLRTWLRAVADYIRIGQEAGTHFDDVDAEAYVIHVLQLVVTATASFSVMGGLLDEPKKESPKGPASPSARKRYDRELQRIARMALFAPPGERPKSREPKSERKNGKG